MISIDKYSYINGLKDVHPLEKFVLAMSTLAICIFTKSTNLHLIILTVMTLLIVILGKIPFRVFIKMMLIPLTFISIGTLGVAVTITKNTGVLSYGINLGSWMVGFSPYGIKKALIIFFRAYASIGCMYFLAFTTPMVDIIWVLKKMKLPSIFTELMIIIYRFIFVLLETASMIYISQDSRLGYSSIKRSYTSLGKLVSNLFLKSIHRSKELFVALTARGYTGDLNVLEDTKSISPMNIIYIALLETSFIILAFIL